MSTPLRENNRRYNHSPLLSPGNSRLIKNRYCMSDNSPHSNLLNNYSPGPLLTPTNYNTSLSTYIDCKSPGLSSRIVQYNNDVIEKSEPFVSHQAKYGSPGIFPIVHLEKKNLPVRRLPRDTVTMRLIPSRDSPTFTIKSNGVQQEDDADNTTNNVLKVLREISKKRNLSEDSFTHNNHKRQRRDLHTSTVDNQSNLNDSTCLNSDTPKKKEDDIPCVVDALAASLTSSNTSFVNTQNILKRKIPKTPIETTATKIQKQSVAEVQTQTDTIKVSSVTQTIEENPKKEEKEVQKTTYDTNIENDIQISVYEQALKDKLTSKLHFFTGQKVLPFSQESISISDNILTDKPAIFNLPSKQSEVSVIDDTAKIPISVTSPSSTLTMPTFANSPVPGTKLAVPSSDATSFSTSTIVTSSSLESVTATSLYFPKSDITTSTITTSGTPKLTSSLLPSVATTTFSTSFGLLTSSTTNTAGIISQPFVIPPTNTISSLKPAVTSSMLTFTSLSTTNSKLEDIQQQKVTNPISSSTLNAPIVFGTSTNSDVTDISKLEPKLETTSPLSSTSGVTSLFNHNTDAPLIFKTNPVTTLNTTISAFGPQQQQTNEKPISVSGFSNPTAKPGGFKFDLSGSSSISTSTSTITTTSETAFTFGNQPTNLSFGANTTVTSTFGSSTIVSTGFESKMLSNTAPQTPLISKSQTSVSSSLFNFSAKPELVPTFSTTAHPSTNHFNVVSTTTQVPSSLFNVAPITTQATSNLFNVVPTTTQAPSNLFNVVPTSTQASSNLFNIVPTTAQVLTNPFNAAQTTNQASTNIFNAVPTTTQPSANLFVVPTSAPALPVFPASTSVNTLGNTNAFTFSRNTTIAPIFNSPTLSTSNDSNPYKFESPAYKNSKPPAEPNAFTFGSTTTSASAFNVNAFSTIQSPNETGGFKFGGSTTNATASMFNKSMPESTPKEQNSLFKFGETPATTTAQSMFNAPAFNFTNQVANAAPSNFATNTTGFNGFGALEAKPVSSSFDFGSNQTSVPTFGTPAFGAENKPASLFGSENKPPSIFGAPAQNQNAFGSFSNQNQTPFATPAHPIQSSQPFQFGGSVNNPPPNVFAFGANPDSKPQPPASNMPSGVFSFNGATTNNVFGTTPTQTFGSTPTQAFGAPAPAPNAFGMAAPTVPTFGTQIQGAMFNIGSGTSTPKPPRTQLKARRRT